MVSARILIGLGAELRMAAVVGRARYDPHAPYVVDLQAARYELSLAKPATELVVVNAAADVLARELTAARRRCPDCTLLGVGRSVAQVELAPSLRVLWSAAQVQARIIEPTAPYRALADIGGCARMLTRGYTSLLVQHDLLSPNPHGVLATILPADPIRVSPRPSSSLGWGLPLVLGMALLAAGLRRLPRA